MRLRNHESNESHESRKIEQKATEETKEISGQRGWDEGIVFRKKVRVNL